MSNVREKRESPLPSISKDTLLLVNDNPIQLDAMGLLLSLDGYLILTADSGESALQMLERARPGLIISDVVMPGIDGIELCRRLKANSATAEIPVLLVSGLRYDDRSVMQGLEAGAEEYLEITAPPSLLTKKIERLTAQTREREGRLKAEAVLRETAEQYRLLFDCNPHPMWVYDLETLSFIAVNDAAVQHYGYSREEFLSMTVADIRPADDMTRLLDDLADAHKSLRYNGVRKHTKADGAMIDVEITSTEIVFQGRKARLVLANDISQRQMLEQQLHHSQKMEAVGRLAGGVAHDFNNLLTAILGYSQLIQRALTQEEVRGEIEQIEKAAQRAATLTGQLLAFSRKQVSRPIALNLNDLVSNLGDMLRRLVGDDIDLVAVLEPELGKVRADPGQIERVILNLVINAHDAMPDGGRLAIETGNVYLDQAYTREHTSVVPGPYVMLAVSDTGVGMDKETQAQIFEPFFTTKEPGKGTGLGLSTVYGIVKQSDANIWVYSEPGHGTTFKIYFPVSSESAEAGNLAPLASNPPRGSETILLVEDEEAVRRLACKILEMNGYKVLEAMSGSDALSICERHDEPIHLMITDLIMPELSGRELAGSVTKSRPEMKLLFMSGYTANVFPGGTLHDSLIAFIEKPFTPDALARKVREVLDIS